MMFFHVIDFTQWIKYTLTVSQVTKPCRLTEYMFLLEVLSTLDLM